MLVSSGAGIGLVAFDGPQADAIRKSDGFFPPDLIAVGTYEGMGAMLGGLVLGGLQHEDATLAVFAGGTDGAALDCDTVEGALGVCAMEGVRRPGQLRVASLIRAANS